MNNRFYFLIPAMIFIFLASCKKDNYEAPEADFTGRLVYKGEALNIQHGNLNFELWQPGFGNNGAIDVNVNQEGSFSAKLFSGDYKLVFSNNQGPFLWPKNARGAQDTIAVNINGNKTLDIEVMPYYMIRTPQLTFAGGKVLATCSLEKIVTDANAKDVERVTLYLSKTQFADSQTNVATSNLAGSAITNPNSVSLEVTVPTLTPSQNYVFARIGVKFSGVDDMLFAPTKKITL